MSTACVASSSILTGSRAGALVRPSVTPSDSIPGIPSLDAGLSDNEAAELMVGLVADVAAGDRIRLET